MEAVTAPREVPALDSPELYANRELSWLDYAGRVLWEARDERNPLLDRVNFLTIFASMLDEFFQIRVSGLRQDDNEPRPRTRIDLPEYVANVVVRMLLAGTSERFLGASGALLGHVNALVPLWLDGTLKRRHVVARRPKTATT